MSAKSASGSNSQRIRNKSVTFGAQPRLMTEDKIAAADKRIAEMIAAGPPARPADMQVGEYIRSRAQQIEQVLQVGYARADVIKMLEEVVTGAKLTEGTLRAHLSRARKDRKATGATAQPQTAQPAAAAAPPAAAPPAASTQAPVPQTGAAAPAVLPPAPVAAAPQRPPQPAAQPYQTFAAKRAAAAAAATQQQPADQSDADKLARLKADGTKS